MSFYGTIADDEGRAVESSSKHDRIERNNELLRLRHYEAKRRREIQTQAKLSQRILNLQKWPLIRYIRSQSLR